VKEQPPSCQAGDHAPGGHSAAVPQAVSLERTAQLFRAMGDSQRLRVLELLKHGERCVTEIVAAVGEKFSTVSQRLRLLRGEGLVARRREGTHIYYALADRHVAELIQNARAHADELEAAPARAPQQGE
jgi:ArsR family transcriptional regulator, lead/cadmium/zinc/bismuth-responsive transcriptional repressor